MAADSLAVAALDCIDEVRILGRAASAMLAMTCGEGAEAFFALNDADRVAYLNHIDSTIHQILAAVDRLDATRQSEARK
ncbi:hypothetical protein [Pigmentiphaga daeguensis]|uniref:Uncharacterized protein n=1 Tax=Pigmentiphaga daeguensis TaxID=414049 RepID=A0ABN1B8E8_9BURK